MPRIEVFGTPFGSSFRPHWALAEVGLEYETRKLDMSAGEHRQPAYLAINPAGQVPALRYDDFVLTESAAMVHYLADKHKPELLGATPEDRATALRWELYTLLNIDKNFSMLAAKTWNMPATPEAEAKAMEMLEKTLPVIEGRLATSPYLASGAFSTADIIVRSSFNYAEAIQFDFTAYPAISAWMARCAERPSYVKAKESR